MTLLNSCSQRQLLDNIAEELVSSNGPEYGAEVADLYMRLISLGQSFDHQNPNSEMVRELEETARDIDRVLGQDGEYGATLASAADNLRSLAEDERQAMSFAPQMAAIRGLLDEGEGLVVTIAEDLRATALDAASFFDEPETRLLPMGDFNDGGEESAGPIVFLTANDGEFQLPAHLEERLRKPLYIKPGPTDHGPTILSMRREDGE